MALCTLNARYSPEKRHAYRQSDYDCTTLAFAANHSWQNTPVNCTALHLAPPTASALLLRYTPHADPTHNLCSSLCFMPLQLLPRSLDNSLLPFP